MKRFIKDIIYLLFFMSIVGVFFYPTVLDKRLPIPSDTLIGLYHPWRDLYAKDYPRGVPFKNFLITDPIRQQIPWRKSAVDLWKQGKMPTWNPYNFSGTSLIANVQAAVFYPFNVFFFFLDFPAAWTLTIMLEPLLAGIFLYVYLRHLGLYRAACLMGAISWSFSGFHIAWLTWGTINHVSLWIPAILIAVDKILTIRNPESGPVSLKVIVLAVILSAQLFAGHSQIFLYVFTLASVYSLWKLKAVQYAPRFIWYLVIAFSLFLVITWVQWYPLVTQIQQASRSYRTDLWLQKGWFFPWRHFVQLVAPDFFGNPTTLNYWGEWNYGEFVGYIGIVPLLFTCIGLAKRDKKIHFWIYVLGISILLMTPNVIARLPYMFNLPIISSMQPTRLMVLLDLSAVMIASYGFDWWLRQKLFAFPRAIVAIHAFVWVSLWVFVVIGRSLRVANIPMENLLVSQRNLIIPTMLFTATVVLFFIAHLYQNTRVRIVIIALFLIVTAVDLLRFGWKFTPFTPRNYFYPDTKIMSFLKQKAKPFRVMSVDDRILPPNSNAYYGIESIEGYDPMYSQRYEEFIAILSRGKADITRPFGFNRIITMHNLDTPLLALLNIRYILSLEDIKRPNMIKILQEGQTRLYEYTDTLPRAYIANNVVVQTEKQRILSTLFHDRFDTRNSAVVEEPLSVSVAPNGADESVNIGSYDLSKIILDVRANSNRLVVVSAVHIPTIKASIDGGKTRIYRVNYAFTGVVVPTGSHRVTIVFQ